MLNSNLAFHVLSPHILGETVFFRVSCGINGVTGALQLPLQGSWMCFSPDLQGWTWAVGDLFSLHEFGCFSDAASNDANCWHWWRLHLWYRHLYHGRISHLFYMKTALNSLLRNWSNSVWQLRRNTMGGFSISVHWIFVIIWSLRRNVALWFGWFLYSSHCVEAFGGMKFFILVDKGIITFEGLCVFKHRWLFKRLGCCELEAS